MDGLSSVWFKVNYSQCSLSSSIQFDSYFSFDFFSSLSLSLCKCKYYHLSWYELMWNTYCSLRASCIYACKWWRITTKKIKTKTTLGFLSIVFMQALNVNEPHTTILNIYTLCWKTTQQLAAKKPRKFMKSPMNHRNKFVLIKWRWLIVSFAIRANFLFTQTKFIRCFDV